MIEQAYRMSKIKLLFIIYVCCLNKTTKTINKLTNEQPRSHFFFTDPLQDRALTTKSLTWKLFSDEIRLLTS